MDFILFLIVVGLNGLYANADHQPLCNVRAKTEYGWVCGLQRLSETGSVYASFRGVPYAKQPVGELRFKELQPPENWSHDYDAQGEGPVCPQVDEVYGFAHQQPYGMSEACIHVNVHTPIYALPHDKDIEGYGGDDKRNYRGDINQEYDKHKIEKRNSSNHSNKDEQNNAHETHDIQIRHKGLSVLVFIHGGGFYCGSGDTDLHGPEYLVSKDVIVITFNYRIGIFGFLSLNTSSIPGNQGLRDQITLLRWVQRNVRNFGGDPDNVTIMGQSSGAANAHLLSLSDSAKGLFKRVVIQSGTAYQAFYTVSPIYANTIAMQFLAILGVSTVDPEEIHNELTQIPLKRIIDAVQLLQLQYGLVNFVPVIETRFPGITTVLDSEPETLIAEGKGNEYPLIIGYTEFEGEFFRRKLSYNNYLERVGANPRNILPARIAFNSPPNVSFALSERLLHRCLGHERSLDDLVACYGNTLFIYQAFRLARQRAEMDAEPTFLYQFAYHSDYNIVQKAISLHYEGASHVEDVTFIFRTNSLEKPERAFPPITRDDMMKDWMTSFIVNFMMCDNPTCGKNSTWPPVTDHHLYYEDIRFPYTYRALTPNHHQGDMIHFYDDLYRDSNTMIANETIKKES